MISLIRRATAVVPAIALLALLTGCATIRASRRIDVGPFSENTMGMVGELQKLNRPVTWTRLKKYSGRPSVLQVQSSVNRVRMLMRGIAFYSTQVASLYDSPVPEERKISELARYMDEIIRPPLTAIPSASNLHVSPGYMDTLVLNIRASKTLLGGLGAAQPLINLTMSVGDDLIDQLDGEIRVASQDLNDLIEAEYAPLKARVEELSAIHVTSVYSYTLLQRYRAGAPAALDSIRASDPALRDFLPSGRPLTAKELDAAERFVLDRTSTIKSLRDQLEPDYGVYRECQAELAELRTQTDSRAMLARNTLILWSRSHRNLAAGIAVPPLIDVMGAMRGTITTGIKGIIP